jgi:UDP-glucose 4-epimerase
MNILITGASGFIGSHLVNHLSHAGHTITAFCRTPEKIASLRHHRVEVVQGLIEDFTLVKRLVASQDAVIHCALGWGDTAVDMIQRDTLPAINLFEQAISANVKKIIATSSCVAVGEYRSLMTEDSVCRPLDFYSAAKSAMEGYLLALSRPTSTDCNILRPIYTFGNPVAHGCATQPDRRFWNIAALAREGEPINLVKNDGTQFIWVGDLVKLYEYFLNAPVTRKIITAASDLQYSWQFIASQIISHLGSSSEIVSRDTGWQANDCIWSNAEMKKVLPQAGECISHLQHHIEYVCNTVEIEERAAEITGVVT